MDQYDGYRLGGHGVDSGCGDAENLAQRRKIEEAGHAADSPRYAALPRFAVCRRLPPTPYFPPVLNCFRVYEVEISDSRLSNTRPSLCTAAEIGRAHV